MRRVLELGGRLTGSCYVNCGDSLPILPRPEATLLGLMGVDVLTGVDGFEEFWTE